MSDTLWLQPDEAAAGLRVSRKVLYSMVRAGEFRRVKQAGREVRIHRDEIYPPEAAQPAPDQTRALRALAEIRQRLNEIEADLAG